MIVLLTDRYSMPALRLAAATRFFNQPLKAALETAGSLGAEGVQLDVRHELRPSELSETGRRQFVNQLEEQSLKLATFEYPTRRAFHDQEELDARVAGLKAALDFAWSLGVKVVVGRIGRVPEDEASPKYQLLVDVLNDIARYSNRVGAAFAASATADSVEAVRKLFERVKEGPLGLNLDPGGLAMAGMDPVALFSALHDRVLTVQVRDGQRDIDGQGLEVPVGRGEVAWDELLALLQEAPFRGWMVATRSVGDDHTGDIGRAIRYVRRVSSEQ